jgi:hypothetical protein
LECPTIDLSLSASSKPIIHQALEMEKNKNKKEKGKKKKAYRPFSIK